MRDEINKWEVDPLLHNELKDKFLEWYLRAKPHDWFTYHHGFDLHETLAVEYVRITAWEYATKGLVYLFLQKDHASKYKWFFRCQKSKYPTNRLIPKG